MPNDSGQLEKFELAIQAVQKSQITSIQKVALSYNVSQSTLQNWLNGIKQHVSANCMKCKLTVSGSRSRCR